MIYLLGFNIVVFFVTINLASPPRMVLHKFIWHIASKIPGPTAYSSVMKYILLNC